MFEQPTPPYMLSTTMAPDATGHLERDLEIVAGARQRGEPGRARAS